QSGTTAEGIHLGAMAGSVDLLQRCYPGIEVRADALWLNPALPEELARLRFDFHYRGHQLNIDIDHQRVIVTAAPARAEPVTIVLGGRRRQLPAGHRISHGFR
ncbi:MAG: glycosyl hydrolase family 65 protein, partial [Leifsonia sp.]